MPSAVSDPATAFPDLAGRRVLVTGASSGIGRALATAFAANGAAVVVHYNNDRAGAEALVAEIRQADGKAIAIHADLTGEASGGALVAHSASELGGLDILVNNAGGPVALVPVATMTDLHFDTVFNLNARSVFGTCRAAIPHLRKGAANSSIINITSLSARIGGSVGAAIYAASKAFAVALTKNLARELAPDRIRVNALSPGYIETPLHEGLSPLALVESWVQQIPLGRAGHPNDCVGAALFLASPSLSGFITGQVIEVNGGQFTGV